VPRSLFALCALIFTTCGGGGPERPPPIGEAFVAPAALELRKEIDPRTPVNAIAKHGERVEIVQRRRNFFRVRTDSGGEGWTHQRMLLNRAEMEALGQAEEKAEKLPSQGAATTLDLLNVHLEPYRPSPTIIQVNEGDRMEVLARTVLPRTAPERQPLIPPRPKPEPPVRKKKEPKYPPPPLPAGPTLREDWLELSKTPPLPEPPEPEDRKKKRQPPPPPALDDWSLVRVQDGPVGWVLTSRLFMLIPDEVAQYAEGQRITSYFALGEVRAGEQTKHHWLWTTSSRSLEQHDFDGFRVFIWNTRRNRYETAYRERNRIGHFPVQVHRGGENTEFSLCMAQEDGTQVRRRYALVVNVVRFVGEQPCEPSPYRELLVASAATPGQAAAQDEPDSIAERAAHAVKRWFTFK
jgi:hypothetical protein